MESHFTVHANHATALSLYFMFKSIFLLLTSGLSLISTAFGYGNAGHQAIGSIAEHYLSGTRAEQEVRALLNAREDLARAATWADRAKIPDKYLTAEMKEFVANNPGHHGFHYCDIPFQEKAYRDGITGTNDHDIVHTLRLCIGVLQKPDDLSDNPLKINKRVALLLIAHLVGDLHQPLHVGCSYVDEQDQFVNPETGAKGQPDAGANCFRLNARTALHGYWDTQTVKLARDEAGTEDFPGWIIAQSPLKMDWNAKGPVVTWPEQWATDTLSLSRQCFQGITLGPRFVVPKDNKRGEHFEWKITLDAGYDVKSRDIVKVELAKAGYRLAALLKAIWPEK
jgi:hypothetical protein